MPRLSIGILFDILRTPGRLRVMLRLIEVRRNKNSIAADPLTKMGETLGLVAFLYPMCTSAIIVRRI
jgi:hypothetical protein